jgi:hypothetical protein
MQEIQDMIRQTRADLEQLPSETVTKT